MFGIAQYGNPIIPTGVAQLVVLAAKETVS